MSKSIFRAVYEEDGVRFDPSSVVLCDAASLYGVKRLDTGAVLVAANTPMVRVAEGRWEYELTDPAPGLWYEAVATAVIGGQVYRVTLQQQGAGEGLRELSAALDPLVVPYVSGAPLPVVHQVERQVFGDFCRQSEAWRYTSVGETTADEAAVPFLAPEDTQLWRFVSATIDDVEQSVRKLTTDDTGLEFMTAPSESGLSVEVTVVLVPTLDCLMGPVGLLERYGHGIAQGVRSYLHGMADKPWTSLKQVGLEMDAFRSAIGDARVEVQTSRGPAAGYRVGVVI